MQSINGGRLFFFPSKMMCVCVGEVDKSLLPNAATTP